MVYPYMIPVYALLVKAGSREITALPKQYQFPVAEHLASQIKE
ncbi:CD1375 family protein [Viridibacillus sp. NPDC096237]